jgi:hypothetical protein
MELYQALKKLYDKGNLRLLWKTIDDKKTNTPSKAFEERLILKVSKKLYKHILSRALSLLEISK